MIVIIGTDFSDLFPLFNFTEFLLWYIDFNGRGIRGVLPMY